MMNVWKPRIQVPEFEMSLAQFWIGAGSFGVDLNSLEAGWQVLLSFILICIWLKNEKIYKTSFS